MHLQQRMVTRFHEAIQAYTSRYPAIPPPEIRALRLRLIEEELGELRDGLTQGDIYETADALADLLYVVYGCAVACGIDLAPVFHAVHIANMCKLHGPKRADGKQLKPEDWQPPDIKTVIDLQIQQVLRSAQAPQSGSAPERRGI